ncbi:hypothetical protein [Caulobacter sp. 17J65-9]|uniref:hypothetical protein n=1 Tax=Caulobacter sp. 17J65-9 TaxID=2709382 RepID=UPI0013CCB473|nr:hypothetical protein [Caulobacter sp. 17J65-9]NEX91870.1 hypothetical protein [Caulobacter sp. 17J65-9]
MNKFKSIVRQAALGAVVLPGGWALIAFVFPRWDLVGDLVNHTGPTVERLIAMGGVGALIGAFFAAIETPKPKEG